MKRRIILFLLNHLGRKKEQSGSGGKAAVGIGCLSAFFMGPVLAIFLFFAIIVWMYNHKITGSVNDKARAEKCYRFGRRRRGKLE